MATVWRQLWNFTSLTVHSFNWEVKVLLVLVLLFVLIDCIVCSNCVRHECWRLLLAITIGAKLPFPIRNQLVKCLLTIIWRISSCIQAVRTISLIFSPYFTFMLVMNWTILLLLRSLCLPRLLQTIRTIFPILWLIKAENSINRKFLLIKAY